MIRASAIVLSLSLALPAAAADTKQMDDLYAGFKNAYAELNKLPAETEGVDKAKADLLERFRSFFGNALSSALIEDLRSPVNGAFDGLRGPERVKDALAGEKGAIDREIGRLNGLKGNLGGTKGTLEKKITGLGKDKTKWDGEVNRLIREIRALGGQASLIGDLPAFAAYPARPPMAIRTLRRHRGAAPGVRVATHKCPWNCLSGHGGSSSGSSPGEKRSNKLKNDYKFHGVADSIDEEGFDAIRDMAKDSFGQRGINNFSPPPDPGNNKVPLPPPPPIPDLPDVDDNAGKIEDLRAKLAVARQNATDVNGRIGELSAEIGLLDVKIGNLNSHIQTLTNRKGDIDAAAKAVKTGAKYDRLNGKALFELKSVTWSGTTAKAVFEDGKAKVTANVQVFGRDAAVSTDWSFTKMTSSLSTLVSAIKGTATYKTEIGG